MAAEITRQAGKAITYQHLTKTNYKAGLIGPLAALLTVNSVGHLSGGSSDSHHLSALIDRPTTPLSTTVAAVLKKEQNP
ncbi:MAG: hypothetical protein KUL87_09590 [Pseudomonas sp.]|nr:hypothetical protein [Pseudomonas sp.]